MNKFIFIITILITFQSYSQSKVKYLENNRFDLNSTNFTFPQKDFNIIGFGAYHGSAKTEKVEIELIESLTQDGLINYYLPETDYSIAYFFNQFLQTGDTVLLKDLVIHYGMRVPQERTIEVYEKWKDLKKINDQLPEEDKIEVIGIDIQVNYKYVSRHILELIHDQENKWSSLQPLQNMVETDTTSYSLGDLSYAYQVLKDFVEDYEKNENQYESFIKDKTSFKHILKNLKISFEQNPEREKTIYENYLALSSIYDFKNKPQFLRMGFAHIEKSREGKKGYPYFFTRLIENKIYPKEKVLAIIGYFTDSKVVWNELYDDNGNYNGFTIEAGFGIGDYEKEYFLGIQNLKDTKISDKTLFRLNGTNSAYLVNKPDLIEIVMTDEKSNGEAVQGMSTLDFLDFAILISDSKASTPIFEMK